MTPLQLDQYGTSTAVFPMITIAVFLFFAIIVACYVLSSIALSRMAQKRSISFQYYAWVPILNLYLIGELLDDHIEVNQKTFGHVKIILMPALFISIISSFIIGIIPSTIGILLSFLPLIAFAIYFYLCIFSLYKIYADDQALKYAIVSILIPFTFPLFLFLIRENTPVVGESRILFINENNYDDKQILCLTLGILALVDMLVPGSGSGLTAGVVGMFFGFITYKSLKAKAQKIPGITIAGMIFSIIVLIINGISILISLFIGAAVVSCFSSNRRRY